MNEAGVYRYRYQDVVCVCKWYRYYITPTNKGEHEVMSIQTIIMKTSTHRMQGMASQNHASKARKGKKPITHRISHTWACSA
jgi:hypothetical protein